MPYDPNEPYSEIYGESLAKRYQGGKYWAADGREVVTDDHGVERIKGAKASATPASSKDSAQSDDLSSLHVSQVKKVFAGRNGPAELSNGQGSKQKMIDWLLANQ